MKKILITAIAVLISLGASCDENRFRSRNVLLRGICTPFTDARNKVRNYNSIVYGLYLIKVDNCYYGIPPSGSKTNYVYCCKNKFSTFETLYKSKVTDELKSAFDEYHKIQIPNVIELKNELKDLKANIEKYENEYIANDKPKVIGKIKNANTNDWDKIAKKINSQLDCFDSKLVALDFVLESPKNKIIKLLEKVEWEEYEGFSIEEEDDEERRVENEALKAEVRKALEESRGK